MLYCERCNRLTESERCPGCESSIHLRAPQADDPVLLCTVRYILATMIEPLLEEEKIPYSKVTLGSSVLLGGGSFLEMCIRDRLPEAFRPPAGRRRAGHSIPQSGKRSG